MGSLRNRATDMKRRHAKLRLLMGHDGLLAIGVATMLVRYEQRMGVWIVDSGRGRDTLRQFGRLPANQCEGGLNQKIVLYRT